jgi:hypothetical protein
MFYNMMVLENRRQRYRSLLARSNSDLRSRSLCNQQHKGKFYELTGRFDHFAMQWIVCVIDIDGVINNLLAVESLDPINA